MFIKKLFLLLVVMLCWGCYHQCKSRRFVADDPWIKIAENWEVGFSVFNWDPCENSDHFECSTVFHLEQKFLDKIVDNTYFLDENKTKDKYLINVLKA